MSLGVRFASASEFHARVISIQTYPKLVKRYVLNDNDTASFDVQVAAFSTPLSAISPSLPNCTFTSEGFQPGGEGWKSFGFLCRITPTASGTLAFSAAESGELARAGVLS